MNDEKSLNITVNPTANTAITTLIMLANAGYEKALAILEKMGVEKEKIFHGVDPSDMVNRPSDIVRELRYVALNRTIEETGLSVLMDLPCGYTPKVFEFTEKGMQYIGCDLPAVINDFSPIIASMTDDEQKKNIDFQVVDVTNYESMKAAADKARGPVCIATEGLSVYLSPEEKSSFLQTSGGFSLKKADAGLAQMWRRSSIIWRSIKLLREIGPWSFCSRPERDLADRRIRIFTRMCHNLLIMPTEK